MLAAALRWSGAAATAVVIGSLAPPRAIADTPDFIPKPSDIFAEFTALEQPRPDFPVGALWVQDFGPYGAAAAAENLETIRSLSGVALSREMQLRLTLGIAGLLNLDPSYRSRLSARFSDLKVVRVKDLSKLAGPPGEPRIYEALRAGTITVSTDSDVGADLNGSLSTAGLTVLGRGDNGRVRSFTIDGKDMFIAYRVVTSRAVRTKVEEERLRGFEEIERVVLHGHEVAFEMGAFKRCLCAATTTKAAQSCGRESPPKVKAYKRGATAQGAGVSAAVDAPTIFPLSLPVADGQGGVHSELAVAHDFQLVPARKEGSQVCSFQIGSKSRILAQLQGTRTESFKEPRAKGW